MIYNLGDIYRDGGDNDIFTRLAKTEIPDINNVLKEYLEMGTDTKYVYFTIRSNTINTKT